MKRLFCVFTQILLIVSLAAPKQFNATIDVDFLIKIFDMKPSEVNYLSKFELGTK